MKDVNESNPIIEPARARRRRLIKEMLPKISEAIASGVKASEICRIIGISEPTWYLWIRKARAEPEGTYQAFGAAIQEGYRLAAARAHARLVAAAERSENLEVIENFRWKDGEYVPETKSVKKLGPNARMDMWLAERGDPETFGPVTRKLVEPEGEEKAETTSNVVITFRDPPEAEEGEDVS